jgi:hypothetical protein
MAFYPNFLPLFFSSDHGTTLYKDIAHDISSIKKKPIFHLTFSESVVREQVWKIRPRVIGVRHPWFINRDVLNYPESRSGTIYFPHHSNPGFKVFGFRDIDAIKYLTNLPTKFNPISVCLHSHDLNGDREELFRSAGFEIITAGDGRAINYRENFLNLISNYRYGISEGWGSQVAYLIKLGIPTQIIFGDITVVEDIPGAKPHGTGDSVFKNNIRKLDVAFATAPDQITPEQIKLVEELLGFKFRCSRTKIFLIAWGSLFIVGTTWLLKKAIKKYLPNIPTPGRIITSRQDR